MKTEPKEETKGIREERVGGEKKPLKRNKSIVFMKQE